jgi:hypothetical protein
VGGFVRRWKRRRIGQVPHNSHRGGGGGGGAGSTGGGGYGRAVLVQGCEDGQPGLRPHRTGRRRQFRGTPHASPLPTITVSAGARARALGVPLHFFFPSALTNRDPRMRGRAHRRRMEPRTRAQNTPEVLKEEIYQNPYMTATQVGAYGVWSTYLPRPFTIAPDQAVDVLYAAAAASPSPSPRRTPRGVPRGYGGRALCTADTSPSTHNLLHSPSLRRPRAAVTALGVHHQGTREPSGLRPHARGPPLLLGHP